MASHGKVYDLFDDRYLNVQDVVGNVEPLPVLVPYEQYEKSSLTIRMDSGHETFLALLQDFTARKAIETGKELWTWCVQWEVDRTAALQPLVIRHLPKKPRLDLYQPEPEVAEQSQPPAPPVTAHLRVIDPELMKEEDMLRILIDIVQVDSAVVPNFVEFLYRWIDFYEGDGKALKAALRGEIPSLWDFEHHPLMVPEDIRKNMTQLSIESDNNQEVRGDRTPMHRDTEQLTHNSSTKKIPEKPDLAALERKAEESERLQYREVRFGIQPPRLDEPLPPLINIPRDSQKRAKYYAACFKSRQRAFYMLSEAGVTSQQMQDYRRGQKEKVKNTPSTNGDGLKNYQRDGQLAQNNFEEKERHMTKQMEIAISSKLAGEPQAVNPLIPATPSHAHRRCTTMQMLRKIQTRKTEDGQKITIVPTPLVGKMRSQLFGSATDRQTLRRLFQSRQLGAAPPHTTNGHEIGQGNNVPKNMNDGDVSHQMHMHSGSLPPPLTLPQPSLPSLPQPTFPVQTSQNQAFGNGIEMPITHHQIPSSIVSPLPVPMASTPPPGFGPQNQLHGSFAGNSVFNVQPSAVLPYPYSFLPAPSTINGIPLNISGYEHTQSALTGPIHPSFPYGPPSHQPNIFPRPHVPGYPTAPGLPTPDPPSAFTQLLIAAQREQGNYTSGQGQQPGPSTLPDQGFLLPNGFNHLVVPNMRHEHGHLHHPPPRDFLQPIRRNAPNPLNLAPQPSPLSSLAPSLLSTSPLAMSHAGVPVQIYFPKVVMPANTLGPGGAKLGDGGCAKTDALLLGYTHSESGEITLSKAVFLPVGVWGNTLERSRKGHFKVLECYQKPRDRNGIETRGFSHWAAYEKLSEAFGFMIGRPSELRERELTKRWRVSRGPMTASERGAVWEGWAVMLDKEIRMSKMERQGALLHDDLIDGKQPIDPERERIRKQIDEWLEDPASWEWVTDF